MRTLLTTWALAALAAPAFAQTAEQMMAKPAAPVEQGPARTVDVRGREAVVQQLVMGPEATALWKKLQMLIADPDIRDFARLVALLDLKVTQSLDAVDWRKQGTAWRTDIKGPDRMIKGGRYGIGISSGPAPRRRFLSFDLEFDIAEFCLSKQEIQRQYATGWEVAGVHSPQLLWQDKTGTAHGFPLVNQSGGFDVAPSGCVTRFGMLQVLEIMNEEQGK